MPSILTAVRDLNRARQIALILTRHGFGEVVSRLGFGGGGAGTSTPPPPDGPALIGGDNPVADGAKSEGVDGALPDMSRYTLAQRIRLVLTELGPSFVKLGQIASTRPDLIPADVIAELKKLQDSVPPFDGKEAQALIEEQLGAPIDELFSQFEHKPLASASIGQVHRAKLRTPEGDRDVVLKVQRPNIGPTIERDLDLLYWFARATERAIPESKTYNPVQLVREFDRSITAELDFVQEAENAERFAKNFEGVPTVKFPEVFRRASGKRVLTMEFLDGTKLDHALAAGYNGKQIAEQSFGIIIKMIFEDGFFHADPHPGNVLVLGPTDAPVLGLLDLGLVGHLSPFMRDKAIDLMIAAVREDPDALSDALYALGKPVRKVDMAALRTDVSVLSRKYLGKRVQDIEISGLISDLVNGAVRHGLDMPPDFLMVGKALMTIEGIGRQLDPEMDIFEQAKPHFMRLLAQRYSPEKLGNDLVKGLLRMSGVAGGMPEQLGEIFEDLRKGHLAVKSPDPGLPGAAEQLGRSVYAGLTVGALTLSGAVVVALGHREWVGFALLALAALAAAWHQLRLWLLRWQMRGRS